MPCDNPPPPSSINESNESNDGEVDDSMYEIIDVVEPIDIEEDDEEESIYEDDAVITFDGHKESVFCCSFDKSGQYVVSGGQDDTAFVWSISTKSVKFECTGHSDSVIAASFSSDSKYVATADMNGFVQVWNVEDGAAVWSFETSEIAWLQWLNKANVLIAGCNDGNCWKWTIPDGDTNILANPTEPCSVGSVSHNDEKLVTGYSDGTLKLWNLSNNSLLTTLSAGSTSHKAAIITIKFKDDDSLIITGSEDGTAKIIKASDFKVLWSINGCESTQHDHESVAVEDVGFCHSLPYVAIGTNCGILSIWDMNTKIRRADIEATGAITKIICDKLAPIVYIAIADGTLQAHDVRSGDAIRYWHGHKAALLDLDLSSDCSLLLTASDDNTCKVFQRGIF